MRGIPGDAKPAPTQPKSTARRHFRKIQKIMRRRQSSAKALSAVIDLTYWPDPAIRARYALRRRCSHANAVPTNELAKYRFRKSCPSRSTRKREDEFCALPEAPGFAIPAQTYLITCLATRQLKRRNRRDIGMAVDATSKTHDRTDDATERKRRLCRPYFGHAVA